MPCASSCSAQLTISSTDAVVAEVDRPRSPIACRMRRMMLIDASWPSNSARRGDEAHLVRSACRRAADVRRSIRSRHLGNLAAAGSNKLTRHARRGGRQVIRCYVYVNVNLRGADAHGTSRYSTLVPDRSRTAMPPLPRRRRRPLARLRTPPHASHAGADALLLNVAHAIDHLVLLDLRDRGGRDRGRLRLRALGRPDAVHGRRLRAVRPRLAAGRPPGRPLGPARDDARVPLRHRAVVVPARRRDAERRGSSPIALTLMGAFASIYHPVGIPMLVQHTTSPARVIGVNGLVGNLGIAAAALLTGLLVKYFGWRMAFVVPGADLDRLRHRCSARRRAEGAHGAVEARAEAGRTCRAASSSRVFWSSRSPRPAAASIFNFTTNGNGELLRERLRAITRRPGDARRAARGGLRDRLVRAGRRRPRSSTAFR